MIDTSLDSSNFYFLLAVVQGIILAVIILAKQPRKGPNLFFGLLLFLFSLELLHMVLEESIQAYNAKFPIPLSYGLAYGPLAYLHVLYIKDPLRTFRWKDLLHFVPSLLLDVILFVGGFLYIRTHMEWAYAHIPLIQGIGVTVAFLDVVQLAIYSYLIYRQSLEAKPVLKEFGAVRDWLKCLLIAWSVLIGFVLLAVPVALYFIEQLDDNSALIYKPLGTIMGLCIYTLGYLYVLKYGKLVGDYSERIQKFRFATDDLDGKKGQIITALINEKVYQDPDISLAKFAGHLGWPINSLSKMINESLHTNFNDLINYHRIEAFKALALSTDSRKYSIMGMGHEVGFSSKASFYRAFKKETGMTPSDFIKSQQ